MEYLDISAEVTDAQYRRVLNSLLTQFEDWRRDSGWCTDLYFYVDQLSERFRWNRHVSGYYSDGYGGRMELDIPDDITPSQRAEDLRNLRGRILQFTVTRRDTISLDKANYFLRTAGLAPYTTEETAKQRFFVSVGTYVSTELSQEELEKKLRRSLKRMGAEDGTSVTIENYARRSTPVRVPDSERTPLLPLKGDL